MHRIFVYGTLKRGHGNHRFYLNHKNTKFLGEDRLPDHAVLKGALTVVPAPGMSVNGEVYEIDAVTKTAIDRLEGSYEELPAITEKGYKVTYYMFTRFGFTNLAPKDLKTSWP